MLQDVLLIAIAALLLIAIVLIFVFRNKGEGGAAALTQELSKLEAGLKEDFRINREENDKIARENRAELANSLKEFTSEQNSRFEQLRGEQKQLTEKTVTQLDKITQRVEEKLTGMGNQARTDGEKLGESISKAIKEFQSAFDKNVESFNNLQRDKFQQMEQKQQRLVESTEKRLDQMRETVEEKLEKTLKERLGQSFETVGKQLQAVQEGLGEMRTLAQDVGGLKKVLSNVKQRGGMGEIQLEMLLEQILAPDQYEKNVRTKQGASELVEFAIKLPGRDDGSDKVYLPVDAKFPRDAYDQVVEAYDSGDTAAIEASSKNMEAVIKKMAKDIHDKYLDPPQTTDFGIMFLPFEGIYAEVVRRSNLLEQLQREFKVIVTGPTTLAAILNSLQMGFRTLALQKRSSEVWTILGAVKTEFETFGNLLEKAQKNITTAGETLEKLQGTRTRAIKRKLRDVEALPASKSSLILPEIGRGEIVDDEENGEA
jgi:DNA recombination protein RmuC